MNHSRNKQQRKKSPPPPPKERILSETSSFGIQSIDDENNNSTTESGLFSLHTLAQTQQPDVISFGRKTCDSNADLVIPKIKNTKVIQQTGTFGRFRVIVCGDSGIGKSLVAQALLSDQQQQQSNEINSDTAIEEYFDKDFCMVDTLGYGAFIHADTVISKVQTYIEKQFEQTNSLLNPSYHDEERLTSLINNGSNSNLFSHVDICLYLTTGRLKNVDIEYMRTIHDLVNIVPVIVQPDTNSTMMIRPEQMIDKRNQILKTLQTHDIHFLDFGMTIDELINYKSSNNNSYHQVDLPPPFVLSWSTTRNSSSTSFIKMIYLSNLKYTLFQNQKNVRHLRQATTLKFMQWRKQLLQQQQSSFSSSSNDSSDTARLSRMQRLHSVSEHRQMIEKEIIRREKKIRSELENERNEKTVHLVLKEYQKQNKKDILFYVIVGILLGVVISQGNLLLFQT